MCELFALSASEPIDIKLSLGELARHGGETNVHSDGWGVAFVEGRDARVLRDTAPAARSPWIACLQANTIRSRTVLAHIRHATRGAVTLANTQPFARELGGSMYVFAHNGTLPGLESPSTTRQHFQPVGETDSEIAFCELMQRVADASGTRAGAMDVRLFAGLAAELRTRGPANLIWASGDRILAHADRRTQSPGVVAPPGLWLVQRSCVAEGAAGQPTSVGLEMRHPPHVAVALLASVPLSKEVWHPLPQGSVAVLAGGAVEEIVET